MHPKPESQTRVESFGLARATCTHALFCAFLGSTAPTPLYPLYIAQWALPHGTATAVFALYAIGTLATLLLLGRYGSRIRDRRHLLLPSILIVGIGALMFGLATDVTMLFAGRFLSGIGTGGITGAATAALYELSPPERRYRAATLATLSLTAGAAAGPLLSSAAIALDAAPTVTPLLLIAGVTLICAAMLLRARWPDPGNTVADESAPVPATDQALLQPAARITPFLVAGVALAVTWTIGSLVMAVGVTWVTDLFGVAALALAGLMPALYQVFAGMGQFCFGRIDPLRAVTISLTGLIVTQALLVVGAALGSQITLFIGMPLYGLFYGAGFVGAAGLVNRAAPAGQRTAILSRFYLVGYLSNAVPVFSFGVMTDSIGLSSTFFAFSILLVATAILGLVLSVRLGKYLRRNCS